MWKTVFLFSILALASRMAFAGESDLPQDLNGGWDNCTQEGDTVTCCNKSILKSFCVVVESRYGQNNSYVQFQVKLWEHVLLKGDAIWGKDRVVAQEKFCIPILPFINWDSFFCLSTGVPDYSWKGLQICTQISLEPFIPLNIFCYTPKNG